MGLKNEISNYLVLVSYTTDKTILKSTLEKIKVLETDSEGYLYSAMRGIIIETHKHHSDNLIDSHLMLIHLWNKHCNKEERIPITKLVSYMTEVFVGDIDRMYIPTYSGDKLILKNYFMLDYIVDISILSVHNMIQTDMNKLQEELKDVRICMDRYNIAVDSMNAHSMGGFKRLELGTLFGNRGIDYELLLDIATSNSLHIECLTNMYTEDDLIDIHDYIKGRIIDINDEGLDEYAEDMVEGLTYCECDTFPNE